MWGWWQTGDNLATLCGEKERQRSDAAFIFLFSFENEKFQIESKQLWSANTTARKKALPEAFLPTVMASYDVQSDSSLSTEGDSDSYTSVEKREA